MMLSLLSSLTWLRPSSILERSRMVTRHLPGQPAWRNFRVETSGAGPRMRGFNPAIGPVDTRGETMDGQPTDSESRAEPLPNSAQPTNVTGRDAASAPKFRNRMRPCCGVTINWPDTLTQTRQILGRWMPNGSRPLESSSKRSPRTARFYLNTQIGPTWRISSPAH